MISNCTAPHWYLVYTYPKAEKKVDSKLREIGITTFLPMHKVVKQWSDRKKKLEVPLFPNYVFVCIPHRERFKALQVKGVVRFISFEGQPVIVKDAIVDSLKTMLTGSADVSNEEFYQEGMPVRISHGQFVGAEGTLIRKNGKNRLLVKINVLHTCVSVDISASEVVAMQCA